mgnify:CR=1 FL=1
MNFFSILGELLAQSGFAALTWRKLCNVPDFLYPVIYGDQEAV